MKEKKKDCCGNCYWFKFEDTDGYGMCQKPHGIAKKCQAVACEQRCSDDACENYISEEQAKQYAHILNEHNKWRRCRNMNIMPQMQDPKEIGLAIDFATDVIRTFIKL